MITFLLLLLLLLILLLLLLTFTAVFLTSSISVDLILYLINYPFLVFRLRLITFVLLVIVFVVRFVLLVIVFVVGFVLLVVGFVAADVECVSDLVHDSGHFDRFCVTEINEVLIWCGELVYKWSWIYRGDEEDTWRVVSKNIYL
ncbi:hypothetical protein Hanom_Chr11g01053231 [Helianthus anomalus]